MKSHAISRLEADSAQRRVVGYRSKSSVVLVLLVGLCVPAKPLAAQTMTPATEDRVKRGTVMVTTSHSVNSEGDTLIGSGTGFFVNSTGLCISNNHVTDPGHLKSPAEKFQLWRQYNRLTWRVILNGGTDEEATYNANVVYSNDQADMAVMQVFDNDGELLETPEHFRFRATSELPLKTKVWNFGFPGGDARRQSQDRSALIAVQSGHVTEIPRSPSGRAKGIVTSILADGGNSGGPVVDVEGRVVGIATLAGPGDTGSSNFTVLVPADLTKRMIQIALVGGKVSGKIDMFPFVDLFVGHDRIVEVPGRNRPEKGACVTMESGSVLCGEPEGETITWGGPLGELEIPTRLVAYMMRNDEYGMLLLDGGDRLRIDADEASIALRLAGNEATAIEMGDVKFASFGRPSERPPTPKGDVTVIGGADYNVSLVDPRGEVSFDVEAAGTVSVPVGDIAMIETTEDEEIRLHLKNGSKMTGEFAAHQIEATLAWSGTPITFSFENVESAVIKTVNYETLSKQGELALAESLTTSDSRFVKLAAAIDGDKLEVAKDLLATLKDPSSVRQMSSQKKEELSRLEAEYLLRNREFGSAQDAFRKLARSNVEDIRWHSRARSAMLERYDSGKFQEGFISDPVVFQRAGNVLATDSMRRAKRALLEIETALKGEPPPRTEYQKLVRLAGETEESLLVANRLLGGVSEELLVRLWRNVSYLHANEGRRLQQEGTDLQAELQDENPRSEAKRRQFESKITRTERNSEEAFEEFQKMQVKLRDAGFIIDDSEIELTDAN